ncbi:hypothetical protein UFOVP107_19 [uncultured Caudovirales phage]|uniref:Uncharacterized protein n=1 Tax=uncultured Caudovirales phage TaxID=2100421 RepID=A0A6J7WR36_9CAUD|nr:hypothetical protein UFOVP107_19 [uncultured Caudovirales phage]CAB5218564.1 hypothetical protein UFOVP214_32 [uncultured Caudovirales phage]
METYLILGNTLIMKPAGAGDEVGIVTVNGIDYHVIRDERQLVSINYEKVAEDYVDFSANVEAHIITHQKMTAWQKTQHGFENFKTIKDNTTVYIIADVPLFAYRAYDATCWQYCTGDEIENCQHYSPWYPAEIQPSADHFTQWVISSIEVK